MSKKKATKASLEEKIEILERNLVSMNNVVGLYVEYNNDHKGFTKFLEERQRLMDEKKKAGEN